MDLGYQLLLVFVPIFLQCFLKKFLIRFNTADKFDGEVNIIVHL